MKAAIHPEYHQIEATCVCGNVILTGSTSAVIKMDICSACHPFFTGTQKIIDTEGRVEKFKKRYTQAEEIRRSNKVKAVEEAQAKAEAQAKEAAEAKAAKAEAAAKAAAEAQAKAEAEAHAKAAAEAQAISEAQAEPAPEASAEAQPEASIEAPEQPEA